MTRRAVASQADIARILRAAKAADVRVAVEIRPDGTIRVEPVAHAAPPVVSSDAADEGISRALEKIRRRALA